MAKLFGPMTVAVLLSLFLAAGAASAAAPTATQKAEFYATCVQISGNAELCTCKADAAMTLIDARFMGVVIASMRGGAPAAADHELYNSYIARSGRVCPSY